ncbi:MAG: zinc-dependent metalloprotease [Actinomycetota bacterium]|nr:zinc-dependent metalloprotease [Actinomycetota bacterium]
MTAQLVDWDFAATTTRSLVKGGPSLTLSEAKAVVAELRELSQQAEAHVRNYTGLSAPEAAPVAVVDRPGWAQSNIDGFQVILTPLLQRIAERRKREPGPLTAAVGSRIAGAEVGTILAYLASRVLGQYEIFLPPGAGNGRLTLVAPNIVATERMLEVDPHDFRLWVCLHEETHRTQFTAVPWLRAHVQSEIEAYLHVTDVDPAVVWKRLRATTGAVADAVLGRESGLSLLEAVQSPEQRAVLDRVTALMSLLEGHADVVMDEVGPGVIPSVAEIRRKFNRRRQGSGPVDRAIRRLLGIDLKMQQYAEGARFVRAVVGEVGVAGFNTVWHSPATLPTLTELRDPDAWLARVLNHRRALPA